MTSRQRLAEVDLRRRGEAVGALAEEDLVDVELQDLVLGRLASIFQASSTSRSLRVTVFSRVRKKLRATCMVIVPAPCWVPRVTLASAARSTLK